MIQDSCLNNCHGCKWLDEVKNQPKGSGYCCTVVRSVTQSSKIRRSYMHRCELYKVGDWATRWQTEEVENGSEA